MSNQTTIQFNNLGIDLENIDGVVSPIIFSKSRFDTRIRIDKIVESIDEDTKEIIWNPKITMGKFKFNEDDYNLKELYNQKREYSEDEIDDYYYSLKITEELYPLTSTTIRVSNTPIKYNYKNQELNRNPELNTFVKQDDNDIEIKTIDCENGLIILKQPINVYKKVSVEYTYIEKGIVYTDLNIHPHFFNKSSGTREDIIKEMEKVINNPILILIGNSTLNNIPGTSYIYDSYNYHIIPNNDGTNLIHKKNKGGYYPLDTYNPIPISDNAVIIGSVCLKENIKDEEKFIVNISDKISPLYNYNGKEDFRMDFGKWGGIPFQSNCILVIDLPREVINKIISDLDKQKIHDNIKINKLNEIITTKIKKHLALGFIAIVRYPKESFNEDEYKYEEIFIK